MARNSVGSIPPFPTELVVANSVLSE